MSGILSGYLFPGHSVWLWGIFFGALGFVSYRLFGSGRSIFSPLVLFFCLGYLSLQFWIAPRFPEHHILHYTDDVAWDITGTLSGEPETRNNRTRFPLAVESLGKKSGESFPACGTIRLTLMGDAMALTKGDKIQFTGKIRSIRNFSNPGGYDYKTRMAFSGIHGSAYATPDKITLVQTRAGAAKAKPSAFRSTVMERMDASTSPASAAILKALIVGDGSGIDPAVRETINRAGLGHLLAISGLHVGIVASFSFFVWRRLFAFCPWMIRQAATRKAAALLSVFPVIFYGWFSGMSPSTQRAVIMVTAFMATFIIERESDSFNTLAIAAFIILIVFPPALFSISFQMSFTAVLAILAGMSRLSGLLPGPEAPWRTKAGGYALSFIAVSFFATLGTLPLVMGAFNQVSLIGWLSNMVGIPLIGFLVVPLGLLSTVAAFFSHVVADGGFWLCGKIISLTFLLINGLAGLDFAAVKTITPNIPETLGFYVLLCGVFYLKKAGWVKYAMGTALLVLALDTAYWVHRRYFTTDMRMTVFDVGQGFASLVELPRGHTLMIDGGGFSDNAVFDVGARIIAPYLWQNKIKTLDTLILSHPNSDHINGLTYIAEHFNVQTVWTNGESAASFAYKAFLEVVSRNGIHMPAFGDIPREHAIAGVAVKILHPPEDFFISPTMSKYTNSNDHSVVVQIQYKDASFLFPGDITKKAESQLVQACPENLKSKVLIAPHHGSKTSSSPLFLSRVAPQTIIIPVGHQNRFKFPHPTVMEKYKKIGCNIFRTDIHGAIRIKTDGVKTIFTPTITN